MNRKYSCAVCGSNQLATRAAWKTVCENCGRSKTDTTMKGSLIAMDTDPVTVFDAIGASVTVGDTRRKLDADLERLTGDLAKCFDDLLARAPYARPLVALLMAWASFATWIRPGRGE